MLSYQELKSQMMDCFKANRIRFILAVVIVQLLNGAIAIANVGLLNSKESYVFGLYGILFCFLLFTNFVMLFMFTSTLRGNHNLKQDARYAIIRFPAEFGFTLVMSILTAGITLVCAGLFASIPLLFSLVSFIASIIVVVIQCFFAYAIHDRCRGVFQIIGVSFTVFIHNWRVAFRAILPYVGFTLIVSLGMQFVVQSNFKVTISSVEALLKLFARTDLTDAYMLLALYVINYVGSAILLTYVYIFYAQLYEVEKDAFPIPEIGLEGTIVIDMNE